MIRRVRGLRDTGKQSLQVRAAWASPAAPPALTLPSRLVRTPSSWSPSPSVSRSSPTPATGPDQRLEQTWRFATAYVWRGVTATNRPVIQPDLSLSVPVRAGTLTLGAWASIEPARYDGASDISAVYGLLPGPAFTQYSAWADFTVDLPGASVSGGAEAYLYPAVADLAALYNTFELSASASLSLPLAPSISVWYDLGAVRGVLRDANGFDQQVAKPASQLRPDSGRERGPGTGPARHEQVLREERNDAHRAFSHR